MTGMPSVKTARTFIVLVEPSTQLDDSLQNLTLSYLDFSDNWHNLVSVTIAYNFAKTVDTAVQFKGLRLRAESNS